MSNQLNILQTPLNTALGGFFLQCVERIKKALKSPEARKDNLVLAGSLLELYGTATAIEGHSNNVNSLKGLTDTSDLCQSMLLFFNAVDHFSSLLRKVNLFAIGAFDRKLSGDLTRVLDQNDRLFAGYASPEAANLKPIEGALKDVVELYVKNYHLGNGGAWKCELAMARDLPHLWEPAEKWNTKNAWIHFEAISAELKPLRKSISEAIGLTWDCREMTEKLGV